MPATLSAVRSPMGHGPTFGSSAQSRQRMGHDLGIVHRYLSRHTCSNTEDMDVLIVASLSRDRAPAIRETDQAIGP